MENTKKTFATPAFLVFSEFLCVICMLVTLIVGVTALFQIPRVDMTLADLWFVLIWGVVPILVLISIEGAKKWSRWLILVLHCALLAHALTMFARFSSPGWLFPTSVAAAFLLAFDSLWYLFFNKSTCSYYRQLERSEIIEDGFFAPEVIISEGVQSRMAKRKTSLSYQYLDFMEWAVTLLVFLSLVIWYFF